MVRSGSTPQPGQQRARARRGRDYATPPLGQAEVDHDLWAVLDLASDGELAQLHAILHGAQFPLAARYLEQQLFGHSWTNECCAGASPFSPVLKTLLADNEPAAAALRGRPALMHRVESRFRFLAVRTCSPQLLRDTFQHIALSKVHRWLLPCLCSWLLMSSDQPSAHAGQHTEPGARAPAKLQGRASGCEGPPAGGLPHGPQP